MMDNLKLIRNMDMESTHGRTAASTPAIGTKVSNMASASTQVITRTIPSSTACGIMASV